MPETPVVQILNALWPEGLSPRMGVFAILDGARDDRIYGAVDGCKLQRECLYAGDLPWQLKMTAPYLVQLERADPFTRRILKDGWGRSWGVFLRTETGLQQLRRHLREFLRVRDEAGRRLIFRYYDPRVLRVYLPTCTTGELETLFGRIDCYMMEGENPDEVLEFRRDAAGKLKSQRTVLPASEGTVA